MTADFEAAPYPYVPFPFQVPVLEGDSICREGRSSDVDGATSPNNSCEIHESNYTILSSHPPPSTCSNTQHTQHPPLQLPHEIFAQTHQMW